MYSTIQLDLECTEENKISSSRRSRGSTLAPRRGAHISGGWIQLIRSIRCEHSSPRNVSAARPRGGGPTWPRSAAHYPEVRQCV